MATTMFSSSVATLHYQEKLPRLPIPKLEDTLARYLNTIKPLVSEAEYEETQRKVKAFQEGEAELLQEKLIAYANEEGVNSYVERFFEDLYLFDRGPCAINVNPFFILEDDPTPLRESQCDRAASLVLSALKFCQAVRLEQLEPDMWRSIPMCMLQYMHLFRKTRIPRHGSDTWDEDTGNHIVVMSRGQLYWFNVFIGDTQIAVTEADLTRNFKRIIHDAKSMPAEECAATAVGVLTSDDRESWCTLRTALQKASASNRESLKLIDSAIFVVCLDGERNSDMTAMARTCLHGQVKIENGIQTGSCLNRWNDKMQIIVTEDGTAGINFEHSFVDGHTVLRFASDMFTDTILRFAKTIRGDVQELLIGRRGSEVVDNSPRKIVWRLNNTIRHGIKVAEARFSDLICQTEIIALNFRSYGKLFITSHNLSPDAFVQMMFQLTYYRLYGEIANAYETVQTKRYYHGRTEAARPLTPELAAFVRVFCEDNRHEGATTEVKMELLQAAVEAHGRMLKACSEGRGVDRHLFALKCIAVKEEMELPELFQDVAYEKLGHNKISTSNCGNPSLRLFGFGPVVADGFGIGYIIRDHGISFAVSSKHRQTQRFVDTMKQCLGDVHDLLESVSAGSFTLDNLPRDRQGSVKI